MNVSTMVDTLAVRGEWPLRERLPHGRNLGLAAGVRVRADGSRERLTYAECSLPRLLFGHNGRLIEDQMQLNRALDALYTELQHIADVGRPDGWRPWRLDMVWNFDLPVRPYVLAHAASRVPGILKEPMLIGCDSLSWRGAMSRFKVTLYDKAKHMRVPGSVLRVEVSLSGAKLGCRLGGSEWRDFSAIWRTYRHTLASITPIQKPVQATGWQEAVGAESPEVVQRIMARLAPKSPVTWRRHWRRIRAAQLPEPFSWAEFLPKSRPPEALNIEPISLRLNHRRGDSSAATVRGQAPSGSEDCASERKLADLE